jgi:aminopeptidase
MDQLGWTNQYASGEIYTSPIENSVEGHVHFDLPTVFRGHKVRGCTLKVKEGFIEEWTAEEGQDYLDEIFKLPGTRRFGEAAIGTNYNIQKTTGNILFDEKIGGTVHMAIGQSYLQAGGKNESSVHWDMIADMHQNSQIFADGERIYENGQFLI